MDPKRRIVYEPNRLVKTGFLASSQEMISNLMRSKELIWRLFLRDFKARYRQSLLGVVWAVLSPVITIGVFVFLNRSGILTIRATEIPYPLFGLIGLTIYGVFATGLSVSSNSIISAGPMVVKINFPKISLVIAAMGQAAVEFLVRLGLIAMLFVFYGVAPAWTALFFPLMLVPLFLFTLGIGLLLSLLAGIFRDVVHLVPFLTTLLLFLVPALYPLPATGMLACLNTWNPLSHFVIGGRELLIVGRLSDATGLLYATIVAISVFFISWRVFFMSEQRIAERV